MVRKCEIPAQEVVGRAGDVEGRLGDDPAVAGVEAAGLQVIDSELRQIHGEVEPDGGPGGESTSELRSRDAMQKTELTNAVLLLQKLKLGDDEVAEQSCLVLQPVDVGDGEVLGEGDDAGVLQSHWEARPDGENTFELWSCNAMQKTSCCAKRCPLLS